MPRASSIEDAALPICREGSEGFDNGRQVLQVRGAASEWLPSDVGPLQSASAPAVGRNRRRPLKSRREGELLGAGDPVLSFWLSPCHRRRAEKERSMDETARKIEMGSKVFLKSREPKVQTQEAVRRAMDALKAKGVTDEELKALLDSSLKLWLIEQELDIDMAAYMASVKELTARQKARKA